LRYRNGQIAVDLLVEKMPSVIQAGVDVLTSSIGLAFWTAAAFYMAEYGHTMTEKGLVSSLYQYPWRRWHT
jgi:TRAP-type C4-dicarboxylate transport system permease small subunit